MIRCATNRDCFHGAVMLNFSMATLMAPSASAASTVPQRYRGCGLCLGTARHRWLLSLTREHPPKNRVPRPLSRIILAPSRPGTLQKSILAASNVGAFPCVFTCARAGPIRLKPQNQASAASFAQAPRKSGRS
jgi:hypothetical protein